MGLLAVTKSVSDLRLGSVQIFLQYRSLIQLLPLKWDVLLMMSVASLKHVAIELVSILVLMTVHAAPLLSAL
jgi:hypothetical protein